MTEAFIDAIVRRAETACGELLVAGPLGRRIFPLPHQPSLRAAFYKTHLDRYLAFIRQTLPAPSDEKG